MFETLAFYLFAVAMCVTALYVVTSNKPVYSVLALVATMFCISGLFVLLDAYFLAVIQVLLYAGAILVLFLFVVMLLDLRPEALAQPARRGLMKLGPLVAAIFLLEISFVIFKTFSSIGGQTTGDREVAGTMEVLGELLFTQYLLPFEVTSVVLLVALVGVIAITGKARKESTQP